MALVGFRAPALPLPSGEYDLRQQSELVRSLRLYFNLIDSLTPQQAQSYRAENFFGGAFTGDFIGDLIAERVDASIFQGGFFFGSGCKLQFPQGAFSSTQDQPLTTPDPATAYAASFNTIENECGVNIVNATKFVVGFPGTYSIQVRIQIANLDNDAQDLSVWVRKNNVDVPRSNTDFYVPERKSAGVPSRATGFFSFFIDLEASDFFEIIYRISDADIKLEHFNAVSAGVGTPAIPETQSIRLTVTFVSSLPRTFVGIPTGSLTLQGVAPSLLQGIVAIPPAATLSLQGHAPTILIS